MLLRRYRLELFHPNCPGTRVIVHRTWFGLKLKNKYFATQGEVSRYYSDLIRGRVQLNDHLKLNGKDTYIDRIKKYEESRKQERAQKQTQRKVRYFDMSGHGPKEIPPRPAPPPPPPMRKIKG